MVQTRSALKGIGARQVDNGDRALPQDSVVKAPPSLDDDLPPPAKRRRRAAEGARARKRSRHAKSGYLTQLNLDVLCYICACLYPQDLLSLARTCKAFRRFLMSKSSAFVWKVARSQVEDLPDCPADLSEPAYAHLAFYAHCHVCDRRTSSVFWCIRRRYCPDCRVKRLYDYSDCPRDILPAMGRTGVHAIIRKSALHYIRDRIAELHLQMTPRDLINSVMQEYERSVDKEQYLKNKRHENLIMSLHAANCERWQRKVMAEHRNELRVIQRERHRSILERLKELGYQREIDYFGRHTFQESRKKSRPLTDKEWTRMLPQWLETMNHHRLLRLDAVVWEPRRRLLESEYDIYVQEPSSDTPAFALLPHVIDLACFPPVQDIIKAPEGAQIDEKPFASALAQLPVQVDEWRKLLDAELAELVKIPRRSSLEHVSRGSGLAPNTTARSTSETNRLRLACALFFSVDDVGVYTHPEVFLVSMDGRLYLTGNAGSVENPFGIRFLQEAPYIVHACGLDPNVTTMEDMDHRNARLRCLICETHGNTVMNWRDAMLHVRTADHCQDRVPLSSRWQTVSDEYIGMIEAVEETITCDVVSFCYERCLLCLPRVGDARMRDDNERHLWSSHKVKKEDIKRGVHYARLGINDGYSSKVEMVEQGGRVTFREPRIH